MKGEEKSKKKILKKEKRISSSLTEEDFKYLGIRNQESKKVILVTNNVTLQMQAERLGIKAESFKDEIFPKLKDQYKGREEVSVLDITVDEFYEEGFSEETFFGKSKIK